eukprot:4935974-Pyramimonas_sp.AAC.3
MVSIAQWICRTQRIRGVVFAFSLDGTIPYFHSNTCLRRGDPIHQVRASRQSIWHYQLFARYPGHSRDVIFHQLCDPSGLPARQLAARVQEPGERSMVAL